MVGISSWNITSITEMKETFYNASSFCRDLCGWGETFPCRNARDIFLFLFSNCTFQDDPREYDRGPFCASSCNDNETHAVLDLDANDNNNDGAPLIPLLDDDML